MTSDNPQVGVTVLGSGSSGNAIVVHTETDGFLIDAGFSARELKRRMREAGIDESLIRAIIVSHEHGDHVRGLRVCAKQLQVPIYANRRTADAIRQREKDLGQVHVFASGNPFRVGECQVEPFSIPHDANDPVGFVIRWHDRKIGLATDLGHASHLVCYQLKSCDLLVVESNHDIQMLSRSERPWSLKQRILSRHGHLSNAASMELLQRVLDERTKHLVLAHASQECNRYELVEESIQTCLAGLGREDISAYVAKQDSWLPTVWV
ncbi:MAG: MBL fold metallo-hydrolase [Lentisphaerae bacterium]|jgi:phosphoribosyl 1,2-cyclic phosphodiesterase|nr:MBL fold metallo-hydrolase [Lentisphaerota bacterium]MBT4817297.1 MBL fold metallo-hydrolase [Lentisphaerota bacterium]MBT5607730.1 MBL fold metallo-hydrolase [Lentisphaerota bacterium]MBT7054893.1 MBL fold metallo-hydrolase [Lentisphaerota bacterium]MBT7843337.1 MBL fold metallo-hydrolase [Lentisphaerota bacterium]